MMLVYQLSIVTDMIGNFQNQRESVLRDRFCGIGRHIADRDAARFGGVKIDIVVAGRGHTDEFEVRTGFDDFFGELHLGGEDGIRVFDCRNDILRRDAVIGDKIAELRELVPVQIV